MKTYLNAQPYETIYYGSKEGAIATRNDYLKSRPYGWAVIQQGDDGSYSVTTTP